VVEVLDGPSELPLHHSLQARNQFGRVTHGVLLFPVLPGFSFTSSSYLCLPLIEIENVFQYVGVALKRTKLEAGIATLSSF
jgi:hypothetical protein